jgi:riboflavin synthase
MFTGLIEQVGRIEALTRQAGGVRLAIAHAPWQAALRVGDSVAVQGACFTATEARADGFACDVLEESMAVTTLRSARVGRLVNLERALALGDRLGGHLVTGHVDGIGRVTAISRAGRDWVLRMGCDAEVLQGIVYKGSIAIDGVSLTVSRLMADAFEVNIIPHTWKHTTLGRLREGDAVNLETDLIGKYVAGFLKSRSGDDGGVTMAALQAAGIVQGPGN